jgi:hypothetical protein
MSTIIKYKNREEQIINEQQTRLIRLYNKETYINNELKFVHFFKNIKNVQEPQWWGGEYYLSENEDKQTIINEYISIGRSWTFYYDKEISPDGNYTKWKYEIYYNGVLDRKSIEVYDQERLLIAACYVDLETNELYHKRKMFYGDINFYKRVDYRGCYLSVSYLDDNSVDKIYYADNDLDDIDFVEFYNSHPELVRFDWVAHPYYHSFDPMMPTGMIV